MAAASQPPPGDEKVYKDVLAAGRSSCYEARDAFYACMEENSRKAATEIGTVGLLYPSDCSKARAHYIARCRSTWVKHFDRQYCAKKKVQRFLDDDSRRGPISLPQRSTLKST